MFCQVPAMQISGANLLASQQMAGAAAKPAAPGFAAALQKTAGFVPRELAETDAAQPETKPAMQAGLTRPGKHIDIKV
jgi:hypothetical protein